MSQNVHTVNPFNLSGCVHMYVFDMAFMVERSLYEYLELVKDGNTVIKNFSNASDTAHFDCSSRIATLQLEKGSKVWVRKMKGSQQYGCSGKIRGHGFTTFSGWLLTAT